MAHSHPSDFFNPSDLPSGQQDHLFDFIGNSHQDLPSGQQGHSFNFTGSSRQDSPSGQHDHSFDFTGGSQWTHQQSYPGSQPFMHYGVPIHPGVELQMMPPMQSAEVQQSTGQQPVLAITASQIEDLAQQAANKATEQFAQDFNVTQKYVGVPKAKRKNTKISGPSRAGSKARLDIQTASLASFSLQGMVSPQPPLQSPSELPVANSSSASNKELNAPEGSYFPIGTPLQPYLVKFVTRLVHLETILHAYPIFTFEEPPDAATGREVLIPTLLNDAITKLAKRVHRGVPLPEFEHSADWFNNSSQNNHLSNDRRRVAGFVSRYEDQHYAKYCGNMQGDHWRKYGEYCYGLIGRPSLTENEKVHNRMRTMDLLDDKTLPFLNHVENGRVVQFCGNPVYIQMLIDIAFGPRKTMSVPVGWHFDGKLPPQCWAYVAMIAYSIIDRYSSGERVVHDLSQNNYGNIFIMVLNAIESLEGEAKVEFENRSVSMWIDAINPQSSPTITARQACPRKMRQCPTN